MGHWTVEYTGHPEGAKLLAVLLQDRGLCISYPDIPDYGRLPRATPDAVVDVVIPFLVAGGYDVLKAALKAFLQRIDGVGHIKIKVDPPLEDAEHDGDSSGPKA